MDYQPKNRRKLGIPNTAIERRDNHLTNNSDIETTLIDCSTKVVKSRFIDYTHIHIWGNGKRERKEKKKTKERDRERKRRGGRGERKWWNCTGSMDSKGPKLSLSNPNNLPKTVYPEWIFLFSLCVCVGREKRESGREKRDRKTSREKIEESLYRKRECVCLWVRRVRDKVLKSNEQKEKKEL